MYLESAQVFDRKVGQVLQRLEDEGVADNTIVFLIADHGRAHIRDKQFLYDGGIRIPCIVRWPGHIDAGVVSDELVSGIDLAPTALSLAGLDIPRKWRATSSWVPMQNPAVKSSQHATDVTAQ